MNFTNLRCSGCGKDVRVLKGRIKGFCRYCGDMCLDHKQLQSLGMEKAFQKLEEVAAGDSSEYVSYIFDHAGFCKSPAMWFKVYEKALIVDLSGLFATMALEGAIESASSLDDPFANKAAFILAEALEQGNLGNSINYEKAYELYLKLSECATPNAEVCFRASKMAFSAIGCKQNDNLGSDLLDKAAALGHPRAKEICAKAEKTYSSSLRCGYFVNGICTKNSNSVVICRCAFYEKNEPQTICTSFKPSNK